MTTLDQKGLTACVRLTDLINYVANHPNEPIPMEQIRPTIEAQAEFTITLATNMLAHLATNLIENYTIETTDDPERDTPPDAA